VTGVRDRQFIPGPGTFEFNARIPIEKLGRMALQLSNAPLIVQRSGVAGADSLYWDPALGSVPTPAASDPGFEDMWNADVEPDADLDGYGDESQDECLGDASLHLGCLPDLYFSSAAIRMVKGSLVLVLATANRNTKFPRASGTVRLSGDPAVAISPPTGADQKPVSGCTPSACLGSVPRYLSYRLSITNEAPFYVTASVTGVGRDSNPADNTVRIRGQLEIDAPRLPRGRIRLVGSSLPLLLKCVSVRHTWPDCRGRLRLTARKGRKIVTVASRHFDLKSGHSARLLMRLPRWARQVITEKGSVRLIARTASPGGTARNSSSVKAVPARD
jgi:hypothetical protein